IPPRRYPKKRRKNPVTIPRRLNTKPSLPSRIELRQIPHNTPDKLSQLGMRRWCKSMAAANPTHVTKPKVRTEFIDMDQLLTKQGKSRCRNSRTESIVR